MKPIQVSTELKGAAWCLSRAGDTSAGHQLPRLLSHQRRHGIFSSYNVPVTPPGDFSGARRVAEFRKQLEALVGSRKRDFVAEG
jgi:hypothetical protein